MATETEKTILEFDVKTNQQAIDNLATSIVGLSKTMTANRSEIKNLEKQNKDLSKGLSDFLENGEAFYTQANNQGAMIKIKEDI